MTAEDGKAAARVGDKTDHDDTPLTPGPGAMRTLINGRPAWLTNLDTKACPLTTPSQHVPEIVKYGSYTVLIEDEMATRVEDDCVGSTFPARIIQGSADVFIGDKLQGLGAQIEAFCKAFCKLMKEWDTLTPDEQKAAIQDLVNEQLEAAGVPPIAVELDSGALGSGSFSWWDGKLTVGQGSGLGNLGAADKTELGKVILHEARHAEQNYRVAQHLAAQPGATATSVQTTTDLPIDVVDQAIANPQENLLGKSIYESQFGSGREYRNQTHADRVAGNEGGYERYRALPEEHDAWDVDDMTNCTCEGS